MSKALLVRRTEPEKEGLALPEEVTAQITPSVDVLRSFLASRRSPMSHRTMFQGLKRVARILHKPVEDVDWHRLRFVDTTRISSALQPYSNATINVTLAALRGILRHAKSLELLSSEDFYRATDWGKAHKKDSVLVGRDLSTEEIGSLKAYCDHESGAYGVFLSTTFAILLGMGFRATESCQLSIFSYNSEARRLKAVRKGGKRVEVDVNSRSSETIDKWLSVRKDFKHLQTPALLVRVQRNDQVRINTAQMNAKSLEYLYEVVAKDAGVKPFTPHDLRRTFCTRLLQAGVDIFTVQRLMGHESSKTTERYDKRQQQQDAEARESVVIW
jgi:integrase/recombinase XerD